MGFNFKKKFKKVVGKKVAGAVSKVVNTKNIAYVAPWASAYTTGGRAALRSAYGGAATGVARSFGGDQAAALVETGLEIASPTEIARNRAEGMMPAESAYASEGSGSGSGMIWGIVGVAVAGIIGVGLILKRKK